MVKDLNNYFKMESEMSHVYNEAIKKAITKCDEKGYTTHPWDDFSLQFLEGRMHQEIEEYYESKQKEELLDIINLAIFCYLKQEKKYGE